MSNTLDETIAVSHDLLLPKNRDQPFCDVITSICHNPASVNSWWAVISVSCAVLLPLYRKILCYTNRKDWWQARLPIRNTRFWISRTYSLSSTCTCNHVRSCLQVKPIQPLAAYQTYTVITSVKGKYTCPIRWCHMMSWVCVWLEIPSKVEKLLQDSGSSCWTAAFRIFRFSIVYKIALGLCCE